MHTPRTRRTALAALLGAAALAALAALLLPSRPAHADIPTEAMPGGKGWPMFAGSPERNMVNLVEKNLPTEWEPPSKENPRGKNIKWVAKLGSRAYSGPVISGGKVFVGTNNEAPRNPRDTRKRADGKVEPIDKGVLMCFDEATGQFLWQHVNDKLPSGIVNDWTYEGVCSTPVVEGNRVYYVTNRCEVVCLDANGFKDGNQGVQDEKYKTPTDADVIWRLDMMRELNVFPHNMSASSPVIVGDALFVITSNGVDEGHINIPVPDAPSFLAVDKNTGKVLWQSNAPGKNIMHGQWSSPTYGVIAGKPQIIFPGGDGYLHAFEPKTGKLLWQFDCNPKNSKYELGGGGTKSDFIATPVVHDGKVYIGVGQDPEHISGVGHLWCIDPSKAGPGNVDISPKNDNFDPKAPVNARSGLVWHFGGPAANPEKLGRDFVFERTMSTCAVKDGLVYAADLPGRLYCLDAQTGHEYWMHDLKGAIWGSPYWAGGRVYLANEDGDVYIFTHGKEKKEPVKIEMGQPVRSTTVSADGVLYVMTESHLYAIQAK
jgi:outer membrane protein assembly factor BamB